MIFNKKKSSLDKNLCHVHCLSTLTQQHTAANEIAGFEIIFAYVTQQYIGICMQSSDIMFIHEGCSNMVH